MTIKLQSTERLGKKASSSGSHWKEEIQQILLVDWGLLGTVGGRIKCGEWMEEKSLRETAVIVGHLGCNVET